MSFWKSIFLVALSTGIILPNVALAHVDPIKEPRLYNQQVLITTVTIEDDHNVVGSADLFFDYIVDPLSPKHDKQSGVTESFPVDSGTTTSFDPPLVIYSHDSCHCDEEFDVDIAAFDHAPVKYTLGRLIKKGLAYLQNFLLGGAAGLVIGGIGDLLEVITEALLGTGLSEDDAAYEAYVQLINDSDFLGAGRETRSTACDSSNDAYAMMLFGDEESLNGKLTYRVVKTELDEVCPLNDDALTAPPVGDDANVSEGEGQEAKIVPDEDEEVTEEVLEEDASVDEYVIEELTEEETSDADSEGLDPDIPREEEEEPEKSVPEGPSADDPEYYF